MDFKRLKYYLRIVIGISIYILIFGVAVLFATQFHVVSGEPNQYGNKFDSMRWNESVYYHGSNDYIYLDNLVTNLNYTLLIEGNKTIMFIADASNIEIQFMYDGPVDDHLLLQLYEEGELVDQYDWEVITLEDQINPDYWANLIGYWAVVGIAIVFLLACLYIGIHFLG